MATLPDYTALGERPTPQAAGGVATYEPPNWRQVGMSGQIVSGAGRDMQEASNTVAAMSDAQDQKTALAAVNKLNAARLGLEQDPTSGFVNVKGNGVVGPQFISDYKGKFQNAQSEIADSLTNENQKRLFGQHAEVVGLQFQSQLLQHQAKQTVAFNATTRDNTITLGLNDIAAHPYDDSTYQTNQLLMGRTVVEAGKDMGLSGDALANFVRVGTTKLDSQALTYRTSGMLLDNPMKAADFFHQHELDFDPQDRMRLAGTLKTAVDAQTSRIGGEQAYKSAVGTPNAAPLPANLNADFVKPYDAARVGKVVEQVKAPSPYDAAINKWAQAYNVSPTELKLRMVAESGGDKDAVSPSGAVGLMQFMPDTAKALKIDPKDPEQSIIGAAILMAKAGGTVGGDMSRVDRTYYGGNADAKGPNTDQYVENMRAVRQNLMGTAQAPLTQAFLEGREGVVVDNARSLAQQQRPGDMVYQDQVIAEARKNYTNQLAALRGTNDQTVSNIMGMFASDKPPQALGDLPVPLQQAYAQLSGTTQAAIMARMVKGEQQRTPDTMKLYYQQLGRYSNDREGFANQDLSPLIGTLPNADFTHLAGLQVQARNKQDLAADKAVNLQHALSLSVNYALKPIGLSEPTKDTPQAKRAMYDQFTGALVEQLDQFKTQNGRPPNDTEIVTMAKNLTTTVQIPGNWFGKTDKRAFEITPEQAGQVTTKVPDDFRSGITGALAKAQGKPPTEAQVQTAYLLHLRSAPKAKQ